MIGKTSCSRWDRGRDEVCAGRWSLKGVTSPARRPWLGGQGRGGDRTPGPRQAGDGPAAAPGVPRGDSQTSWRSTMVGQGRAGAAGSGLSPAATPRPTRPGGASSRSPGTPPFEHERPACGRRRPQHPLQDDRHVGRALLGDLLDVHSCDLKSPAFRRPLPVRRDRAGADGWPGTWGGISEGLGRTERVTEEPLQSESYLWSGFQPTAEPTVFRRSVVQSMVRQRARNP
jgi:hypothetical protein